MAPGPGKLQLVYKPADGSPATTMDVYDFKGPGVAMSMYNTDEVRSTSCHFHHTYSTPTPFAVDHRLRSLLLQDGSY